MTLSPRVWTAGSLAAGLVAMALLLVAVRLAWVNQPLYYYEDVASYKYLIASGVMGLAGALLQIPVAAYLLCKSSKLTASPLLLEISMFADAVVRVVVASGVSASYDLKQYVGWTNWTPDTSYVEAELKAFLDRGIVAAAFLLAGLVASACAAVASAKLRIRAESHDDDRY